MLAASLNDNLVKYDEAIKENKIGIEQLIELEKSDITEKEVEKILSKLIEEAE